MDKPLSDKQMHQLVTRGIGPTEYKGAFRDANYLGNPGKDLFFWIETVPPAEQIDKIAQVLADKFPRTPPHNPIQYGACVRYIYGMFEKQGVLRSKADKKRMIKEQQSWDSSEPFITSLYNCLEYIKSYFGLALLCEQIAHRLGDKSIMKNDLAFLVPMEQYYEKAYKYALKCMSKKHLMTTYHWASMYFIEAKQTDKAITYCRKAVKAANAYCPDARQSLRDKIVDNIKYLKSNDPDYKAFIKYWSKNAKNKAVIAVVKKFK